VDSGIPEVLVLHVTITVFLRGGGVMVKVQCMP